MFAVGIVMVLCQVISGRESDGGYSSGREPFVITVDEHGATYIGDPDAGERLSLPEIETAIRDATKSERNLPVLIFYASKATGEQIDRVHTAVSNIRNVETALAMYAIPNGS
jgi:biopolymer transport protein ExbD